MAGYVTPMLLTVGVSFGNKWKNSGSFDWKIPVEGAVATGILALVANIKGAEPVVTALAWAAFLGSVLLPVQKPSPAQNVLSIIQTNKG